MSETKAPNPVADVDAYKAYLSRYYDSHRKSYDSSYTGAGRYRSNYFRLNIVMDLLTRMAPRPARVVEPGCGNGRVVAALQLAGFECVGFDNSPGMLAEARQLLTEQGLDQASVIAGDIYDIPLTAASWDAIVCIGVIQNLPNHAAIFQQFRRLLKPGGRLIVSVSNDLFSLMSLNMHTVRFHEALYRDIGVPEPVRNEVLQRLAGWLDVEHVPTIDRAMADAEIAKEGQSIPSYNALNVAPLFREHGFQVEATRFYHYHPLPPRFEKAHLELFGEFAERLETTEEDWRGALLCNAMVVQSIAAE
jgi:SAM-dependent methyltransferase